MKKKEIKLIKDRAKAAGIHPLLQYAILHNMPTCANEYLKPQFMYSDANHFMEDLFGVFESEGHIAIHKTDGFGYEQTYGWRLIRLFFTEEDARKYVLENYRRVCFKEYADGLKIYNHDIT